MRKMHILLLSVVLSAFIFGACGQGVVSEFDFDRIASENNTSIVVSAGDEQLPENGQPTVTIPKAACFEGYRIPRDAKRYYIFKSRSELDKYLSDWEASVGRYSTSEFDAYRTKFDAYQNSFFDRYILVMLLRTETSGGIRFVLGPTTVENDELNILVHRFGLRPGLYGASVMVDWHFLVPIRKDLFDGEIVNLDIKNW